MPIYEYQALNEACACPTCRRPFEVLQGVSEKRLAKCPDCGCPVRKMISWCRAAVAERSEEHTRIDRQIRNYEHQGMWSHAAELADKHAEKTKDQNLKTRALDNYRKAGYDPKTLDKHANSTGDQS